MFVKIIFILFRIDFVENSKFVGFPRKSGNAKKFKSELVCKRLAVTSERPSDADWVARRAEKQISQSLEMYNIINTHEDESLAQFLRCISMVRPVSTTERMHQ